MHSRKFELISSPVITIFPLKKGDRQTRIIVSGQREKSALTGNRTRASHMAGVLCSTNKNKWKGTLDKTRTSREEGITVDKRKGIHRTHKLSFMNVITGYHVNTLALTGSGWLKLKDSLSDQLAIDLIDIAISLLEDISPRGEPNHPQMTPSTCPSIYPLRLTKMYHGEAWIISASVHTCEN